MKKSTPYSLIKTALVAAGFVLTCHAASAGSVTYTETGDAGDGINGNAQLVTGPSGNSVSAILGNLTLTNGISEADAFMIYISSPSLFSASTAGFVPGKNSFDSQLFLFSLSGMGIVANDDDGDSGGFQSTIPAGTSFMSSLTAGYYYLVITGSSQNPTSSLGDIFPSWTSGADSTGVFGPTGDGGSAAFSGFGGSSNEGGAYSIALTGVSTGPLAVPEPSSLALVLGGLAAMASRRRRRA